MRAAFATAGCLVALGFSACKVPLEQVTAGFVLADATWFADEQTLFIFYDVEADQGLGPNARIEVAFITDDVRQPFIALDQLTMVHQHLPADCGAFHLCGSASIKVEKEPRNVQLQLRYHVDGALTLGTDTTFNVVGAGPPWARSLIPYGVFNATNDRVEWRSRNQFPTIRNEQATALGLRRVMHVADDSSGDLSWDVDGGLDPYGYGIVDACPASFAPLDWAQVQTDARAVWAAETLPIAEATDRLVCGRSTTWDAKGTFDAPALAQKNPEVRPAFPMLRSAVRDDVSVGFALRFCNREINEAHREMQLQRLLLTDVTQICLDDWQAATFADTLAGTLRATIDTQRAKGHDMVLSLAFNHDDPSGALQAKLETALETVLQPERDKTSPRVSGAFVFDSFGYTMTHDALKRLVLWCPASTNLKDLDKASDASHVACAILPDFPDLMLGPFKFSTLPILPTRDQYVTFIGKYSEEQAGRTVELSYRAPELTPLSRAVPVGDFGVVTFFNDETFSAAPSDAFSFCQGTDSLASLIVVEGPHYPQPAPISLLPQLHSMFPDPPYSIGVAWDFPFLMRLKYEIRVAGAATAFNVTVPFGVAAPGQSYYGTPLWLDAGTFDVSQVLAQCTRFCDNPTFDSAGVYDVQAGFRETYGSQCYRPLFPAPPDGGFPLDP